MSPERVNRRNAVWLVAGIVMLALGFVSFGSPALFPYVGLLLSLGIIAIFRGLGVFRRHGPQVEGKPQGEGAAHPTLARGVAVYVLGIFVGIGVAIGPMYFFFGGRDIYPEWVMTAIISLVAGVFAGYAVRGPWSHGALAGSVGSLATTAFIVLFMLGLTRRIQFWGDGSTLLGWLVFIIVSALGGALGSAIEARYGLRLRRIAAYFTSVAEMLEGRGRGRL